MITVEQIKAARALLDWSQEDLAKASGMSKPSLANLERRASSPRKETLDSIQRALEEAGVEFTEGPGVKLSGEVLKVQVFEGNDSIIRLWNDIFDTLKNGEERLISGVDEGQFTAATGKKFDAMMHKYVTKNIKGRILSLEGDTNFADPSSEYRWVPESVFMDVPYYVYDNKYAIVIWEPSPKVVLVENKTIADTYRKQFERHWDSANIPPV